MYRTFLIVLGILAMVSFAFAEEKPEMKGREKMELNGGSKGKVPFPHSAHQTSIDCAECHKVFPKEEGSIDKKKADGSLKNKHVMNKVCISCHKSEQKAGKPSGPTSCSKCHFK